MAVKSDFETKTANGLVACARWLEDNACDLARTFAEGCQQWSIEFVYSCYDECPSCPKIHINIDKIDHGIIDAYTSHPSMEDGSKREE